MLDAHPQIVVGPVLSQLMAHPSTNDAHALAIAAKKQASELLTELLAAKAASQTSGRDLFAAVTGASALDNAIAEARAVIANADRMLVSTDNGSVPRVGVRATILAKSRDDVRRVAM